METTRSTWNPHWIRLPLDEPHNLSSLLVTGQPSLHRAVRAARGYAPGSMPPSLASHAGDEIDNVLRTSTVALERGHLLPPSNAERALAGGVGDVTPMRWMPSPTGRVSGYVFRPARIG